MERLFYLLIREDALEEDNVKNKMGFFTQYVKVGARYKHYLSGRAAVPMQVRMSPGGKPKMKAVSKPRKKKNASATGVKAVHEDHPASTNVSSPLRARSAPRVRRTVVESDSDEGELDFFEPIRKAGIPRKNKKHEMGPPITTDDKIAQLDDGHRHVLEDFVEKARDSVSKIMMSRSLRRRPVSDTILREIAIAFPKNRDEMLNVEGMTEEIYQNVGQMLLKLIKAAYVDYDAIMRAQEDLPDEYDDPDVVEISDDDDGFVVDDEGDDNEDEDVEESENSRYFSASAEVDRFNSQSRCLTTEIFHSNCEQCPTSPCLDRNRRVRDSRSQLQGQDQGRRASEVAEVASRKRPKGGILGE